MTIFGSFASAGVASDAASDQVAAVPPSPAINSRRFIQHLPHSKTRQRAAGQPYHTWTAPRGMPEAVKGPRALPGANQQNLSSTLFGKFSCFTIPPKEKR